MRRLAQSFFARCATSVAIDLLGARLVSCIGGQRVSGFIVETEAYCAGESPDLACHGSRNRGRPTDRTRVMFGPAGYAYVYFVYGNHWMFNVVTGREGVANAVLVRALEPSEGLATIAGRRTNRPEAEWTNGPAKLAQALGISGDFDGCSLCDACGVLWIEAGQRLRPEQIASGPRVGLGKTPEPWRSIPWRYWIRENRHVSKFRA